MRRGVVLQKPKGTGHYQITIPKAIVEKLDWKKGDLIEIRTTKNGLKVENLSANSRGVGSFRDEELD